MGVSGAGAAWALWLVLAAAVSEPSCALKHRLRLEHEHRSYFIASSFGLLKGGHVTVNASGFAPGAKLAALGLSVHRSPEEATEYTLSRLDADAGCIFKAEGPPDEDTMRIELCTDTGVFTKAREKLSGVGLELRPGSARLSLTSEAAADMYAAQFLFLLAILTPLNSQFFTLALAC